MWTSLVDRAKLVGPPAVGCSHEAMIVAMAIISPAGKRHRIDKAPAPDGLSRQPLL
jgi:hypothetical protein